MGFPLVPLPPYRRDRLILSVHEATSWLDRRQFAGLPWRIYRGDRYWVPPSHSDRMRLTSPRYSPQLQAGRFALFLAEARNVGLTDELVGSIAVWLVEEDEEDIARFGCFEAINDPDVAEALIEAAEFWLSEQFPISVIRGPYPLDGRDAPGLLIDGYNVRALAHLPYNPPYYPELVEQAGYEPISSTQAFALTARPAASAYENVHVARQRQDAYVWEQIKELCSEEMPADALFGLMLEEHGEATAALCLITEPVRGFVAQLADRFVQRRRTRLFAHPAVAFQGDAGPDQLKALYSVAAASASTMSYEQVIVAPVRAKDNVHRHALETCGAHPIQTYQLYEKRF